MATKTPAINAVVSEVTIVLQQRGKSVVTGTLLAGNQLRPVRLELDSRLKQVEDLVLDVLHDALII